jgi:hypothetical protein
MNLTVGLRGEILVQLEHKEPCAESREKAEKLVSEFDMYTLRLPAQVC